MSLFRGSGGWKLAAGAAFGALAAAGGLAHRPLPASAKHIRLTPAPENDPT